MKNTISLLLVLSLISSFVLTSCRLTTNDVVTVEKEIMTLDFSFGERTGTYTGEVDIVSGKNLPNGKGTFKTENDDGEAWIYNGEWKNGHLNGKGKTEWTSGASQSGTYKMDVVEGEGTYIYTDGDKYVGNFKNGDFNGKGTYTFSKNPKADKYVGTFYEGNPSKGILYFKDGGKFNGSFANFNYGTGTYTDKDGYEYKATLTKSYNDNEDDEDEYDNKVSDENDEEYDFELKLLPKSDFFSDKKRVKNFEKYLNNYQFDKIQNQVEKYIKKNDVTPIDSANEIQKLLKPIIKYKNNYSVSTDKFDGDKIISFKNANTIDSSHCINATITSSGHDITIGFIKNGWLFFDKIRISNGKKVIYENTFKSYNIDRKVLGGSSIKETVKTSFYTDEIIKSNNCTLRFENSDNDEYYEYKMSRNEIIAIYLSYIIPHNKREMDSLLIDYQDKIEEYS